MTRNKTILQKLAAALLIVIGLVAMLSAWDLLLLAQVYSRTVLALELGGVVFCLAGYFLYKSAGRAEKDLKEQEEIEETKETE